MASNKTGMKKAAGKAAPGLGGTLIRIVGVGFAGGTVLIGVAKKVGEKIQDRQAVNSKKLEERRAADREEARLISDLESGNKY